MKSIFVITFVAFCSVFYNNNARLNTNVKSESDIVYICTGPKAKVYHKYKDCKGLNRCSGDVISVTLEKAKKTRRACKICY